MSELKVTCTRCETELKHQCRRWRDRDEEGNAIWREDIGGPKYHENPLVHAFVELMLWVPEGGMPKPFVEAMKQSEWYSPGDENSPFLSQAVIYPLLDWKDNARSLQYLLYEWMHAGGFDSWAIRQLVSKAKRWEDHKQAITQGGLLRVSEMEEVDWTPQPGFTVCLTAVGVGKVTSQVARSEVNERGGKGPRADWDVRVYFEGGGDCHFSRLLRVAHWIKDADGQKIWPPPEEKIDG